MSAFVVTPNHIAYLVNAAQTYRVSYDGNLVSLSTRDQAEIGAALLAENQASVNHRYTNHPAQNEPYVHPTRPSAAPDPVQTLKAVSCYEYQSCEHPAWEESAAYRFCQDLTSASISRLPGYDEAEWEIT